MMNGLFRGVVAAVDDDEARLRYRVRVATIHHQATSPEHLPHAEVCTLFSAPGAGDLPHFEVGDRVWVAFERGDVDYPVIMGGWVAKRNAVEDLPTSMTADYAQGRKRWTRYDRSGNVVEMSEQNSELHVMVRSGESQIRVRAGEGSVSIESKGIVHVKGTTVSVQSDMATVEGSEVVVNANGRDGASPAGRLILSSNKDIHLHVRPLSEGGTDSGTISIGQHRDEGNPSTGGVPSQHQTPNVNIYARNVKIGALNDLPDENTLDVTIKAANSVAVESAQSVSITAATTIDVQAPQINIG